ncbi:MAG TPA: DUF4416 family protein [Candidatus Acidoferrales bacterium]|nr:DUF4416 family protein [Candidatus Acidoferrales bacterium]
MGLPREPDPVKLFVALLCNDSSLFAPVESDLRDLFGPVDHASAALPWAVTDYYREEMGPALQRKLVSFHDLTEPGKISAIKNMTQDLESKYLWRRGTQQGRSVNLDPGYLEASKVVLASTKNAAHRVYLGGGIYAEVTLQFRHGAFEPQPHTYVDYRWPETLGFFLAVRSIYLGQLRARRRRAS